MIADTFDSSQRSGPVCAQDEGLTNAVRITVIGDRFMRPGYFSEALQQALPDRDLVITELELPFPDEPMISGHPGGALEALKEFQGDPEMIFAAVGDAAILVNHLAPLSGAMIERLSKLDLVAMARGGAVNIDMQAARRRGLKVVNAPGRNASAVAEFTIGAILAETRHIRRGHEALRAGHWRGDLYRADVTGREISELTVGVVGYGAIGHRVVRLLSAFGAKILVTDPYVALSSADLAAGVEQVDASALWERSDVITLHARLTDETRNLVNRETLAKVKPGAFLINTARGPMVEPEALIQALDDGRLAGAMLETFPEEPVLPGHPLLSHEKITVTPHIAGASLQTIRHTAAMVAEEVRRHLQGQEPLNPL